MSDGTVCPRCNSWLGAGGNCVFCGEASEFLPREEVIEKAQRLPIFTTNSPMSLGQYVEVGLVFGTSSKVAFWGLSKQSDRLTSAYQVALANLRFEAASLGADAVVGVTFALNNSTGSAAVLGGSSEAVMLLGTAVKKTENN